MWLGVKGRHHCSCTSLNLRIMYLFMAVSICAFDCSLWLYFRYVLFRLIGADHLPKMDAFGSCDPYVELKLGDQVSSSHSFSLFLYLDVYS